MQYRAFWIMYKTSYKFYDSFLVGVTSRSILILIAVPLGFLLMRVFVRTFFNWIVQDYAACVKSISQLYTDKNAIFII